MKKRSKASRMRGSKTHGCGSMKKRRGAGHRGGVGNAGTGKRGDVKKPSIWKNTKYFGKFGFKKKNQIEILAINIRELEQMTIETTKELNLKELGYNKLLGTGTPTKAYKIKVEYASAKAIEKIKAAKGTVTVAFPAVKE